jgi:hypothetical protein
MTRLGEFFEVCFSFFGSCGSIIQTIACYLKNSENPGRVTENEKQFKEEEAKDLIDLLKLEFCNPQ